MTQINTIIFDLDGTLVNASPDIAAAANFVLRQIGWPELPVETIAGYIGGGAEVLWRKILGDQAEALLPSVLPPFLERYTTYACVDSHLYPGAMELLTELQKMNVRMGIATQKVEKITMDILDQLGIAGFFKVVVGPESVKRRKPDPESVLLILEKLQAEPSRALMIGDAPADILAGKAAGVRTCAVTFGYGRVDELLAVEPDHVIDRLMDVLTLLD